MGRKKREGKVARDESEIGVTGVVNWMSRTAAVTADGGINPFFVRLYEYCGGGASSRVTGAATTKVSIKQSLIGGLGKLPRYNLGA